MSNVYFLNLGFEPPSNPADGITEFLWDFSKPAGPPPQDVRRLRRSLIVAPRHRDLPLALPHAGTPIVHILQIDGMLAGIRNNPRDLGNESNCFAAILDPDDGSYAPGNLPTSDDYYNTGGGGFSPAIFVGIIKVYGTQSVHVPVHRDFTNYGRLPGLQLKSGRILVHFENIAYGGQAATMYTDSVDIEGHLGFVISIG